jgi:hypothetical protein
VTYTSDHPAARRRIAQLRAKIADRQSDVARLRSMLRAEVAALAAGEPPVPVHGPPRSAGAMKLTTRQRRPQAPGHGP